MSEPLLGKQHKQNYLLSQGKLAFKLKSEQVLKTCLSLSACQLLIILEMMLAQIIYINKKEICQNII